jgi:hypothetical protein
MGGWVRAEVAFILTWGSWRLGIKNKAVGVVHDMLGASLEQIGMAAQLRHCLPKEDADRTYLDKVVHSMEVLSDAYLRVHGGNDLSDIECKFNMNVHERLRLIIARLLLDAKKRGVNQLDVYSHGNVYKVSSDVVKYARDREVDDFKRLITDIKGVKNTAEKAALFDRWCGIFRASYVDRPPLVRRPVGEVGGSGDPTGSALKRPKADD